MRLPRKCVYALLLFVLGLNFAIRFPRTSHELGLDGFVFHGLTSSLVQLGYAKWIIHPLSYLGLFPLSHPSGSLFMLGSLTLTSGLPLEGAVLFYDFALVGLGLLAGFALSMEVRRDPVLGLLISALFSLSPRFVTGVLWEVPTRALFTTLIPIFLFCLLRWHRTRDTRWAALTPVVLILMMLAHRLAVLMAAIVLAFVVTAIIVAIARTLRLRYASRVLGPGFRRGAKIATLITFFVVSAALIVWGGVLASYGAGRIGVGSGIVLELTNLIVSLTRSAGVLIVFVPFGAVAIYQSKAKTFKEPFLLTIMLVLIPTLSLRQYTGYYIVPFTAVFIGIGLWQILRRLRSHKLRIAFVASALAATLVTSQLVLGFDLESGAALRNESYSHGLYVKYETSGTVVSNDGRTGSEVFAVSGHPYMPVGGATTPFQSPELLVFDFVNTSKLRIEQLPWQEITVESDSPFILQDVNTELDWASMLDRPYSSISPRMWKTYHPAYLLEIWDANLGYFAYAKRYDSPFVVSVHAESYKVFEIQGQTLWYLG